jgi:hypothetical protein
MYTCFLVILLFIGCKSSESPVENVHPEAANTPPPVKVSPTIEPPKEPPAVPDEIKINWQGSTNSFYLDWNGKDLLVQLKGGIKQKILSRMSENFCRVLHKDPESRNCRCGNSFRLASVVGNIVSFEDESDFSCAGSYLYWRYASLDLEKSGDYIYPTLVEFGDEEASKVRTSKVVAITDLFSEADVLAALLANSQISRDISKALSENKMKSPPTTLSEFSDSIFTKYMSDVFDGAFYLRKDYLTRFVFHHIEGDKVAVWISLTSTSHAAQAVHEHVEILLPIPDKLREPLVLADSGQQGFLMKDAEKYVGTSRAKFEFGGKNN